MGNEQFSFKRGWMQVKQADVSKCRAQLMSALGIKTRMALLNRLNGVIEPKVSEARAIEKVFAGFGITDVWGKE